MEAARYARDLAGGVALAFIIGTSVPVLAAAPLVWQTGEGFRSAKAEVPATGKPGFTLLPPADTGIHFTNRLTDAMVAANRLLENGSGVALGDVDGDGTDDLVVAGGKTGRTVVFRNDGQRGLVAWTHAPVPPSNPRDQTGVAVWRVADGTVRIVSDASNWEDADADAAPFVIATLKGAAPPVAKLAVINQLNSTGPVAMADIDGDGDLDLFIGGRAVAGRYPEPATSLLLRNDGGVFVVAQTFADIGLVNGAVSTDFDGDGDADLALACDWGPVRLLRNDGGKFTDVTTSYGMNGITGCWNGITTADLDGDGRMDLVVSNWGRNWSVDPPSGSDLPARLYYGDLADNGGVQTLLASMDPQLSMVTPWRQWKTVAALLPAGARFVEVSTEGIRGR